MTVELVVALQDFEAQPNGLATLDGSGKLVQMPTPADVGAIATTARGAANGVAPLDAGVKVPDAMIPSTCIRSVNGNTPDASGHLTLSPAQVDAISIAAMGVASGVATLDAGGKVPAAQLNTPTAADVGAVPTVATEEVVYANNSAGQLSPMAYTVAATPGTMCFRDGGGRVQVSPGTASTDAATYDQLQSRLSDVQRTAIDALTVIATPGTATAEDVANKINAVINALKAT